MPAQLAPLLANAKIETNFFVSFTFLSSLEFIFY
jgi:hypothetical protein